MHWYTYLFFALALFAFIFGTHRGAQTRNALGFTRSILMTLFWLGLGLWTGGFIAR